MMRICDAGKHASADLSPRYLQPRRAGAGPNQTSLRGHFIMFPSIILQIKDTEPAIVWRTKALMTLLLPAIKRRKKKSKGKEGQRHL